MNNLENEPFQFMLQENEKSYDDFDRHFNSIEKTFTLYLVIIASLVTVNGYLIKDHGNFTLFALNDFQILCAFFIALIGLFSFLKVMEHRLLIISYTKSLNLNRKWFVDRFKDLELPKYLFWKAGVSQPKYYRPYRYFYWELLGLSTINAPFISILVINLIIKLNFKSKHFIALNWLFLIVISIIYILVMMQVYKIKSTFLESDLSNKDIIHT